MLSVLLDLGIEFSPGFLVAVFGEDVGEVDVVFVGADGSDGPASVGVGPCPGLAALLLLLAGEAVVLRRVGFGGRTDIFLIDGRGW